MQETLVPIVIMTGMFAMIFGIVYIRSRENMSLIERGINPRTGKSTPKPFISLKYGLLLVGCGLGLLSAYLIDIHMHVPAQMVQVSYPGGQTAYRDDNPAIYFALVAIGGGMGLVISYIIEKKWLDKNKEN